MIKYSNLALSTFLIVSPAYSAGKGLPQLDFTTYPSLIFWSILSLLILYFVMSYSFRELEVSGKMCLYSAWFQPHAVWHVGTAISAALQLHAWLDLSL